MFANFVSMSNMFHSSTVLLGDYIFVLLLVAHQCSVAGAKSLNFEIHLF